MLYNRKFAFLSGILLVSKLGPQEGASQVLKINELTYTFNKMYISVKIFQSQKSDSDLFACQNRFFKFNTKVFYLVITQSNRMFLKSGEKFKITN